MYIVCSARNYQKLELRLENAWIIDTWIGVAGRTVVLTKCLAEPAEVLTVQLRAKGFDVQVFQREKQAR